MGVAVGMLVAGLIVGYMLGARKELMKMLKKMAAAAAKAEEDKKGGDEEDDKLDDDEEEGAELKEILEMCMVHEVEPGLDDHADTVLNPIVLYQIKKVKDELRKKALLEQLAAQEAGEEVPQKKIGHLKILSQLGALTWLGGVKAVGSDAARSQEIREKMKTVDTYLQTTYEVETAKAASHHKLRMQAGGKKIHTAMSLAEELKWHPLDSDKLQVDEQKSEYAKRGRSRVQPPLDHAIAAAGARRASCGARHKKPAESHESAEPAEGKGDVEA